MHLISWAVSNGRSFDYDLVIRLPQMTEVEPTCSHGNHER